MSQTVKLRKTVIKTVQASQVVAVAATLDDGSVIQVTGPISVGDYNVVEIGGESSILSAADFDAERVV